MTKRTITLGLTGSRIEPTWQQKETLKEWLVLLNEERVIVDLHHGDCIGADSVIQAIIEARFPTINVIIHPPINEKYRAFNKGLILPRKEYLERNKDIVDSCDLLIAFPKDKTEVLRSGTWSTIRYAVKKFKTVKIFLPNGRIEHNLPMKGGGKDGV